MERPISDLESVDSVTRTIAADYLGEIGDPRAVEPLIRCLKDGDHHVRSAAAKALGKIGDPEAIKPLIPCLHDEYFDVRNKAEEALANIGVLAMEPLSCYLKGEGDYTRAPFCASRALGSIGAPAIEILISCLRNKDESVRYAAARGLETIGVPAVEYLIA